MNIIKTEIQDCFIVEPTVFNDPRGYFLESFNQGVFQNLTGLSPHFIQDNESKSSYGVIRGLHAQAGSFAQAKLVRVVIGKVLDVVLDIRPNSPSFGKMVSEILDGQNKKQLFVPKGCLHGFSVLEDNTIFSYKCDGYYNRDSEISVNPLDEDLNINWQIQPELAIISEKDRTASSWKQFVKRGFF